MRLWLVAVVVAAGCASANVAMTPKGEAVAVEQPVDGCGFVAMVACEVGGNGKTFEHNSNQCINELRNKAGALGATHITLGSADRDGDQTTAAALLGSGSKCRNCVSMTAKAHKCEAREECLSIQSDYEECLQRGGYDPTVSQ